MSTKTKAELELDILIKNTPDSLIKDFIPEILGLVEAFGNSGQSGGSAPYTAGRLSTVIKKLCLQEPISPISGVDEEWMDVSNHMGAQKSGRRSWQNKRCYGLFKNDDGVSYTDAIVWKNQHGITYGGSAYLPNGTRITSSQNIKGFPFEPKTFYVDIIEEEVAPDDWTFHVKPNDLTEAFNYYENPLIKQRNEKIDNIV